MSRALAWFLMLSFEVSVTHAADPPCVNEAKPLMSLQSSWAEMSKAAVALPAGCFDGYFAEGISDTIVRKGTGDWLGFTHELEKHTARNDKFFLLVLESINSTLNPDDIRSLAKLAQESCPRILKGQCDALLDRTRKALEDY